MGRRGPKPRGEKEEIRRGRPGKRTAKKKSEQAEAMEGHRRASVKSERIETCPRYLSREAKEEWRRLAPRLHKLELLNKLSRTTFAAFCNAVATWRRAQRAVAASKSLTYETNSGARRPIPELKILKDAEGSIRLLGMELGLTPRAIRGVQFTPDVSGYNPPADPEAAEAGPEVIEAEDWLPRRAT